MDEANCVGMPLEIFYGTLTEPLTRKEATMARQICSACPVRRDCLIVSFRQAEPHGVWAGLTNKERSDALRKHKGDWIKALAEIFGDDIEGAA